MKWAFVGVRSDLRGALSGAQCGLGLGFYEITGKETLRPHATFYFYKLASAKKQAIHQLLKGRTGFYSELGEIGYAWEIDDASALESEFDRIMTYTIEGLTAHQSWPEV